MIWDLQKVLRAKGVIFAKGVKSRFLLVAPSADPKS